MARRLRELSARVCARQVHDVDFVARRRNSALSSRDSRPKSRRSWPTPRRRSPCVDSARDVPGGNHRFARMPSRRARRGTHPAARSIAANAPCVASPSSNPRRAHRTARTSPCAPISAAIAITSDFDRSAMPHMVHERQHVCHGKTVTATVTWTTCHRCHTHLACIGVSIGDGGSHRRHMCVARI
jgi:hypothetical protein